MLSATTTIPLIILLIYTPVLIVLFVTQVVIIIINKKTTQFRSSYFSLYIIEAISGLGTTMATMFTDKLIIFPEVNSFYVGFPSNAITTGLYFSSYYFPACQEYTNIFIALNRYSAINFYKSYEKIWNYAVWICLLVIFGFPFISYYHLVDVKAFVDIEGSLFNFGYDHSTRPWKSNRVQTFYLYLITSIITFTLNLASVVTLRCRSMKKVSSTEIRLFMLGFSSFACGLPMTILQLKMFTMSKDEMTSTQYIIPWFLDLKALSPAILSLIFSTAIRKELRRIMMWTRASKVSSVH